MARDNIPVVAGAMNGVTAEGAAVAITVANGGNILAVGQTDNLVLVVLNSFAGAKIVTVKAGIYPPAFRASMGDLTLSCIQSAQRQYIFLEAARFVQADGSINVDYEAAMTGSIWAFKLPAEAL